MRMFLLLMLLVPVMASAQLLCPVCVKKDLKSTVHSDGFTTCTLLGWERYWDEDGKYHSEDPNTCSTSYSCSQGHEWGESCQGGSCKQWIYKDDESPSVRSRWGKVAEGSLSDGSLLLGDAAVLRIEDAPDGLDDTFVTVPDSNDGREINMLDEGGNIIVFASVNEGFKIYPDEGPHIAIHDDCSVSINRNSSLEKILGEFAKLIALHSGGPLCNLDGIHPGGVFRLRSVCEEACSDGQPCGCVEPNTGVLR